MLRKYLVVVLALLATAESAFAASSLHVIDGDTLDLEGARYRLHGIDAPEAGQSCRSAKGGDWPCGQMALQKLESLTKGRAVKCSPREKDAYGRWIAICFADGVDINGEMIAAGYAWAFRRYSTDYAKAEDAAHARKVGIWQAETQPAWDFRSHKWESATNGGPITGCPIKGNINRNNEKIYHAPWSKDYEKTTIDTNMGERWFCSEEEAVAAGWRPPHGRR